MNDGESNTDGTINRRRVLAMTGAVAAGGIAAAAGAASAHPPEEVRFCGCSRVCVQRSDGPFMVITATDVDGDFECQESSRIHEDTCVDAGPDEKIVAIRGGDGRIYCNPNHCAEMVRERSTDADCPEPGDCVSCTQHGRHEYVCNGVTIRTNQCKPPGKWDDGRGGPPSDDQGARGDPEGRGRGRGSDNSPGGK